MTVGVQIDTDMLLLEGILHNKNKKEDSLMYNPR